MMIHLLFKKFSNYALLHQTKYLLSTTTETIQETNQEHNKQKREQYHRNSYKKNEKYGIKEK